jgi:hypothetical protein
VVPHSVVRLSDDRVGALFALRSSLFALRFSLFARPLAPVILSGVKERSDRTQSKDLQLCPPERNAALRRSASGHGFSRADQPFNLDDRVGAKSWKARPRVFRGAERRRAVSPTRERGVNRRQTTPAAERLL